MDLGAGMIQALDRTPVSALVALAYVTLAFLTDPVAPTMVQLREHGALLPVEVADGAPWRLLSYAFLHHGALHLALNTLALLYFGPRLELSLGSLRFGVLYLLSALGGGLLVCLWNEPEATFVTGGSGALFGMAGATLALGMRTGPNPLQFLDQHHGRSLLGLIAVNLVLGFVFPMISNTCHLGGLFAGFAATWWLLTHPRGRPDRTHRLLQTGLLLLLASATTYAIVPVARWDHLLLAWERSEEPERRLELRRAFSRSWGADGLLPETMLRGYAADLRRLRTRD